MKILAVDDEGVQLKLVKRILSRKNINNVVTCDNSQEAIKLINAEAFDVVLLDILMPMFNGLQVLKQTKPYNPSTEFIIITGKKDVQTSVEAMKLGAYDYLEKPFDQDKLIITVERAFERKAFYSGTPGVHSKDITGRHVEAFSSIITNNDLMFDIISYTDVIARSGRAILITGESGTGKELFAKSIHLAVRGAEKPYVPVNVSSVPENLFESQFFGHKIGAYTGATHPHSGYFQQADTGTLFLDEIGELPLNLQPKLLRVLEDGKITPIGETKSVPVDCQIVSASNRDLQEACQKNLFRLDLYYRLSWAAIHLPPLRKRKDDIPLLAAHFLKQSLKRYGKSIDGFSTQALNVLMGRDYPGNVRELSQAVESAVLLCNDNYIQPVHLGSSTRMDLTFERTLCSLKDNTLTHVAFVLSHTAGNIKEAAEILGIDSRQVYRRLAELKEDSKWSGFTQ